MLIETLKLFCDVVETQSFSKAAAANYISQSAVSQQIRNLEERFGQQFIERAKRGLHLTEAGQTFYQGSKEIIQRYQELTDSLQSFSEDLSGMIRVATIYSVGLHDLPPYLRLFLKSYPQVNVHVEFHRANRVYDEVLNRNADIGLVAYPARRPQLESALFREDKLLLICHPDHPLAAQGSASLKQLENVNYVAFDKDIPTRKAVDRLLRERQVTVRTVMAFDNIETIKRAVEINAGVSIVPRSTVRQETEQGVLKEVDITEGPFLRPVGIIYRKGRALPRPAQKFMDILRNPLPEGEE
ncbi:MAG: LysR family transcriptional regulator [Armatimonadetes bacterium]|nr:LysR family transcriptional regulator [Armatimonadota bacterium]